VVHDNPTVNALGLIPGGGIVAAAVAALEAIPNMPKSGKIAVNHENILGAAKIIKAQADTLSDTIADRSGDLLVQAAGGDTISRFAADRWNENLVTSSASYTNRVQQYVKSLNTVVDQLRDAAVQYGFTEDEIVQTFGKPGAQ
jgi:gas vesicle protein